MGSSDDGIGPKAGYHHGDLGRALVAMAARIIGEEGIEALTLREVGRRLGVSRTALYRHFAGKGALLEAVALEGFVRLRDALEAALAEARPRLADRLLPFDPSLSPLAGLPVREALEGAWQGISIPARAWRGEAMTNGDLFAAASLMMGGGAFGTAPEGALRAGAPRTGWRLSADDMRQVSDRLPDDWWVNPNRKKEGFRWTDPPDEG